MEMYLTVLTDAQLMTFQLAHTKAPCSYDKALVSLCPPGSQQRMQSAFTSCMLMQQVP